MLDAGMKNGKFIPYGCLLTKVFKFFKIKLDKEEPREYKYVYNKATFTRIKSVQIGEA